MVPRSHLTSSYGGILRIANSTSFSISLRARIWETLDRRKSFAVSCWLSDQISSRGTFDDFKLSGPRHLEVTSGVDAGVRRVGRFV